MLRKGYNMFI